MFLDEKKINRSDMASILIMIISGIGTVFFGIGLIGAVFGNKSYIDNRLAYIITYLGYTSAFLFLFVRAYKSYRIVRPIKQLALYIADSGNVKISLDDASKYALNASAEKTKNIFNTAVAKGYIKNAYYYNNCIVILNSPDYKNNVYYSHKNLSLSNAVAVIDMCISAFVLLYVWAAVSMILAGEKVFDVFDWHIYLIVVFVVFLFLFVFGYKKYLSLKSIRRLGNFIECYKKEISADELYRYMERPKKKVKKLYEQGAAKGYFKNTYLKYENEFTVIKIKQENNKRKDEKI